MTEIQETPSAETSILVPLRLVPVEVFGENDCCEHGIEACPSDGYGLSDAVSSWSDCNRAIGHIYRVDEGDSRYRQPGETVTVYVNQADLPFFQRNFDSESGQA